MSKAIILRNELRWLLFWAKYGLEKATGGSKDQETVELVKILSDKYRLQIGKPSLGKYVGEGKEQGK